MTLSSNESFQYKTMLSTLLVLLFSCCSLVRVIIHPSMCLYSIALSHPSLSLHTLPVIASIFFYLPKKRPAGCFHLTALFSYTLCISASYLLETPLVQILIMFGYQRNLSWRHFIYIIISLIKSEPIVSS